EEFDLSRENITRLLILDEIHKAKGWKQKLKGLYDELGEDLNIVVTGSARLNFFKRGGESLMGRYLHFRLHPFTFGEIEKTPILSPEQWKSALLKNPPESGSQETLERLMRFSGFPEPFLANDLKILRVWRKGRIDK